MPLPVVSMGMNPDEQVSPASAGPGMTVVADLYDKAKGGRCELANNGTDRIATAEQTTAKCFHPNLDMFASFFESGIDHLTRSRLRTRINLFNEESVGPALLRAWPPGIRRKSFLRCLRAYRKAL